MITKDFIDEFRRFADNEVHPLVSPYNYHAYSRLIYFIDELEDSVKEQELLSDQNQNVPVRKISLWTCGSCSAVITNGDKYCRMCGKRVKWE